MYAARAGYAVTVCEKEGCGGQITQAHRVDNFPGLPGISGIELGDRLCAQAMDAGAQVAFCAAEAIDRQPDGTFSVTTDDGVLEAKAVIFAGGAKPRTLGLANEQALLGRGVSYCALCDGAFFKGQDVAVVGGGSTAFSDAFVLAGLCRSVTLIHRRDGFRAEAPLVEAARKTANIRILTPCTISALQGEDHLTGIMLNTGEILPVQALFVALGRVPDCKILSDYVNLDEKSYVLAGEDCTTRTPGLFVAGDCRKKEVRQLTTAVADGTVAAMAACEYLKKN